ncbi:MAG: MBL fold metallo-hydrolase [Myxococcales bacterium]|nr:MBL fold metallo-hydrolase [Myxococcales bacterium]
MSGLLGAAACTASIPQGKLDTASLAAVSAPIAAVCVLVHKETKENLGDGARGWFRGDWMLAYTSFVLRRADGSVVLIDASTGATVPADLDAAPFWFRWFVGAARDATPLATLLHTAGIDPGRVTHVLVTHPHWDHTGGLAQVPGARVLMSAVDADWVLGQESFVARGAMPHYVKAARDRIDRIVFDGPAVLGWPASRDVFGDGSVLAVPTPGHTPGSTSYLVRAVGESKPWLFVGDAAWVQEGFAEPVHKGRLASAVVDIDKERTADTLGTLHAVHVAGAAHVVTAHDARTWTGIARCPLGPALPLPGSASPATP